MKNIALPLVIFPFALLFSPLIYIGLLVITIAICKIWLVIFQLIRDLRLKIGRAMRRRNVMSKKTPLHKESFYQAKIIRWLKETYPRAFVWKAAAGPYSRGGIPDICMVLNGRFFGFEVKRPETGRLSRLQEQAIGEINAAGGIAAVVSYPDEVERIIRAAGIG